MSAPSDQVLGRQVTGRQLMGRQALVRLRSVIAAFAFLISVPLAGLLFILARSAYREEFTMFKNDALRATIKIREETVRLFARENERRFDDYSFFKVSENPLLQGQAVLGFSNLSNLTPEDGFPGVIGYFQFNPDGSFQSPLLPDLSDSQGGNNAPVLGTDELARRSAIVNELERKTARMGPIVFRPFSESAPIPQAIISTPQQLRPYYQNQGEPFEERSAQEHTTMNSLNLDPKGVTSSKASILPGKVISLGDDDFAFVRQATINKQQYLQGFVVRGRKLLDATVRRPFLLLDTRRPLAVEVRGPGSLRAEFLPEDGDDMMRYPVTVLERALPAPLQDVTVIFRSGPVGLGPSGAFVLLLGASVGVTALLGLFVLYRLGAGQIELAKERGNFVSAVSHELKTPLTSIRMYAEMLDSALVENESKRKEYYRFILEESERLSRLVNDVLQFARIENRSEEIPLREADPLELLRRCADKARAPLQAAGFELRIIAPEGITLPPISCNEDALLQILINLTDNAVKFSAGSDRRRIDLGARRNGDRIEFFVRDYGPGVPKRELAKIFRPFYRAENELTRNTKGTGLGLGLVAALAARMNAAVSAADRAPGLEVAVSFPTSKSAHPAPAAR